MPVPTRFSTRAGVERIGLRESIVAGIHAIFGSTQLEYMIEIGH